MKARIKYIGYIDNDKGQRIKTTILAQGHIIKQSQLQLVISINGTTSTIRQKNIIEKTYVEDLEEINYACV